MGAIDELYKAMVDRYKTVEISPTIWIELDQHVWHNLSNDFTANDVATALPSTFALREESGFEIRARPLLVFRLRREPAEDGHPKDKYQYFAEMCAEFDAEVVDETA
jgi:hypothetical protein